MIKATKKQNKRRALRFLKCTITQIKIEFKLKAKKAKPNSTKAQQININKQKTY